MNRPQLSIVVNQETGEVSEGCPECADKDDQIEGLKTRVASLAGTNTRIKREHAELDAVAPNRDEILEVMAYWRVTICPGAKVTASSKGWRTVKARLAEPDEETGRQFTVLELKAAVVGMTLDQWHMDGNHRHRRYLENAFSDAGKVNRLVSKAVSFKRTYGASALTIVDELAGASLVWLAERCSCGHLRLDHVRQGPTPDGRQPCDGQTAHDQSGMPVPCECTDFDWLAAKLEARWAELVEQAGQGDLEAQATVAEARWMDRK